MEELLEFKLVFLFLKSGYSAKIADSLHVRLSTEKTTSLPTSSAEMNSAMIDDTANVSVSFSWELSAWIAGSDIANQLANSCTGTRLMPISVRTSVMLLSEESLASCCWSAAESF